MSGTSLTGWGRTGFSQARVLRPRHDDEIAQIYRDERFVIARGLGRSYGDAAQLGGGVVLDNRGFDQIGPVAADGTVRLGAGVSFDELLTVALPLGWFVPVTPGTRQVTMGGALGADVHGKNHHVDGSFASHVRALRVVTPQGTFEVSPERDPELFWGTFGAMGLTGFVTELTLALAPVETDQVLVDTDRFDNLEAVMNAMIDGDANYHYSVAWVDCMTRGKHLGRAILTRGEHATRDEVAEVSLRAPRTGRLRVPFAPPSGLLNRASVRAFNELWFRSAPRHEAREPQSIQSFFHPLDGVRDWNLLYGKRGFVQYQFVVPDEHAATIEAVITRLSSAKVASFLAVLKRFGPGNRGPLSFPRAGWTLALDLPVGAPTLARVLDELDDLVLEAGGRIYFAKDARLDAAKVGAMYPRLGEFRELKERVDPRGQLTSDLARRLHLVGN
ncbi:MAG: FAD-binding oxidoreductase [Acidobacteriota bacterium]|nr:FAD-binding oxidoreductase [Acidobacteriota bacterium]MDE3223596.1 FAD-binding oxidoreductase [Acidobacteriota bacterium]